MCLVLWVGEIVNLSISVLQRKFIMKRITCRVCGKRRKPWWSKYHGDTIVRIHPDSYWETTVIVRPTNVRICINCIEKRLKI